MSDLEKNMLQSKPQSRFKSRILFSSKPITPVVTRDALEMSKLSFAVDTKAAIAEAVLMEVSHIRWPIIKQADKCTFELLLVEVEVSVDSKGSTVDPLHIDAIVAFDPDRIFAAHFVRHEQDKAQKSLHHTIFSMGGMLLQISKQDKPLDIAPEGMFHNRNKYFMCVKAKKA